MSDHRPRSLVWQYFKKIEGGSNVKCILCNLEMVYYALEKKWR